MEQSWYCYVGGKQQLSRIKAHSKGENSQLLAINLAKLPVAEDIIDPTTETLSVIFLNQNSFSLHSKYLPSSPQIGVVLILS